MSDHERILRLMSHSVKNRAEMAAEDPYAYSTAQRLAIKQEGILGAEACIAGADALARACSSCAHYDANSSATEGVGYCTNPVGWHRAKPLPPHEMCSKWAKADE